MRIISFIIALLLVTASAAGYAFLWIQTQTARAVIATAEEQAAAAGEQEALIRATNTFVIDAAPLEGALSGFVAHDDDIVAVIETIEAAAARERVNVEVAKATVGVSTWRRHEPVSLIVTGRGSFTDLVAFITALEHFPVASRVEALAMESTAQGWLATIEVAVIKEKPLSP